MSDTLQKFVQRHWIKQVHTSNDSLTEEINLLEKAGFKARSLRLSERRRVSRAKEHLTKNYKYTLKVPPFKSMKLRLFHPIIQILIIFALSTTIVQCLDAFLINVRTTTYGSLDNLVLGIVIGLVPTVTFICFGLLEEGRHYTAYKIGFNKFLVETSPSRFKAEVPANIAQATIEARNNGLTPRIWLVANSRNINDLVVAEKIDPLLVGYAGKTKDYVALLGIWGSDIEELDELFSNQH